MTKTYSRQPTSNGYYTISEEPSRVTLTFTCEPCGVVMTGVYQRTKTIVSKYERGKLTKRERTIRYQWKKQPPQSEVRVPCPECGTMLTGHE